MLPKTLFCHSERSEESRKCLLPSPCAGFFALLRMTGPLGKLLYYLQIIFNLYKLTQSCLSGPILQQ